jgi:hypothetical protein
LAKALVGGIVSGFGTRMDALVFVVGLLAGAGLFGILELIRK